MTADLTIILLTGWSGCGKDAAAALMAEEMHFTRFAFADAVKQECATLYGLSVERFHLGKDRPLDHTIPLYPTARTPRELLLLHAADMRAKDDALYARIVANEIRDSATRRVVISDWRYRVELTTIRAELPHARLITIRIQRPGIQQSPHPSEHELDTVRADVTLHNDGCISDLRDRLKTLLRPFLHTQNQVIGSCTQLGS